MRDRLSEALQGGERTLIGEVEIRIIQEQFILTHRDDAERSGLDDCSAQQALEIAKYDDQGQYRPLRTAPNLRHGWKITVASEREVRDVVGKIYPGRLAVLERMDLSRLGTTPLRETLERQSGRYRIAARISDEQIDAVVGRFCRSDGGCLRTILWRRDRRGAVPSSGLPAEKFDPSTDQFSAVRSDSTRDDANAVEDVVKSAKSIPLICQEACNLLVSAARDEVKGRA